MATEEEQEDLALQREIYLTVSAPQGIPDQVHHLNLLNELLVEYEDLFIKPQSLPPTWMHDHSINLKPHTEAVNIRTYRYPPIQKNEIEKMVREMLQQSIIRPSQSPFASPILLVKKK